MTGLSGQRQRDPSISPSSELVLDIQRLDYAGRPLFQDFHLSALMGGWTCLLGPSGVGKSTLLRIAAGLEPDAKDKPLPLPAAWMGQSDGLLPWSTVRNNVLLGARLRGRVTDADRTRASDLLAQVGLSDRGDDRPATLSGGMRQRVALARTLMEDRPLVLMDEPFSALDPATRLRMGDLASRLLQGKTVLLVTHDPLEALRLGHRVIVLGGRPARIQSELRPEGAVPRAADSPALMAQQAQLLLELAQADGQMDDPAVPA